MAAARPTPRVSLVRPAEERAQDTDAVMKARGPACHEDCLAMSPAEFGPASRALMTAVQPPETIARSITKR